MCGYLIIVTKLLNAIEKYYRCHDAPSVSKIHCTLHEAFAKLEGDIVFISYSSPMVGD